MCPTRPARFNMPDERAPQLLSSALPAAHARVALVPPSSHERPCGTQARLCEHSRRLAPHRKPRGTVYIVHFPSAKSYAGRPQRAVTRVNRVSLPRRRPGSIGAPFGSGASRLSRSLRRNSAALGASYAAPVSLASSRGSMPSALNAAPQRSSAGRSNRILVSAWAANQP